MGDVLRVERHGRVLRVTLNRPEEMNALNTAVIDGLFAATQDAAGDPRVGAVLVDAVGPAFCAGADLKEARELVGDAVAFRAWLDRWMRAFDAIEALDKPVIAAVDGLAVAGGLELALACDVIVASERARLGDGHVTYGLVPGGGGSLRLPEAVGTRMARWMMYTGALLASARALDVGLVQQVLPVERFETAVLDEVGEIASRSMPALAFMKRRTATTAFGRAELEAEADAAAAVIAGPDAQEGLRAFVEKREPAFPSVQA